MTDVLLLFSLFLTSFLVAFSGAMMPGPLLTLTIAETPRRGIWTGPLLISGHALLELLMVFLLLFGLGPYLQSPLSLTIIGIGGAIVLFFLAQGLLNAPPAPAPSKTSPSGQNRNPLLSGIIASLANPYWTIWWVTIGLATITQATKLGFAGVAFFFAGHILADFIWCFLVSLGFTKGRKFMGEKGYRFIMKGCGILLILFGLWFGYSGFHAGLSLFN